MYAAGVRGLDPPGLDTLAAAEAPPRAVWRDLPELTSDAELIRQATTIVGSMEWRRAQTMLTSRRSQVSQTLDKLRWRDAFAPPREMVNARAYEAGQALAAKWANVLDALDELLAHAEEHIPHLSLAALSKAELRELASKAAAAQQQRLDALLGGSGTPVTPEHLRAMDYKTHLPGLRKQAKEARQHAAALFGTVGEKGSIYSDSYSVKRWTERQESARAFTANKLLVLANGKTVPLSDVLASSVKAHKARLYAMAKGMDEHATRLGWAAAFVTVTLPPEYHPNPRQGAKSYDPNLSPADADKALAGLLTRMRAEMRKKGISPYGICVKEPHLDGCPHAHVMLYMPEEQVNVLDTILQKLRPEPVPGERIATKLVRIDRTRALPTTYLFKYLMKSVNAPIDTDEDEDGREDGNHLANHEAVRAWASERGIRRWATWGTHGVQRIWQAIHQRKDMPDDAPKAFHEAGIAISERRYADALGHMGAIRGSGNPRMRLVYEDKETEYGDTRKSPCGVRLDGEEWTMPLKARTSEILSQREHSYRVLYPMTDEERETEDDARWFARLPDVLKKRNSGAVPSCLTNRIPIPAVVVSYPRADHQAGEDGNPRSTAGPPDHHEDTADAAETPETHPKHQCTRTLVERANRAANERRAKPQDTEPDDTSHMIERAMVALGDEMAEAVSCGNYVDTTEDCF